MTAPVSALGGAAYDGAVKLRELPPRTMISIRGDLSSTALKNVATGLAGVDFPGPGEANCVGEKGILWMSPDEVMVMCPRSVQQKAAGQVEARLKGTHHLAADVSDARSLFLLEGEGARVREVLARLSPADLHPDAFPPGRLRRTRLAQVPAAFWMRDADAAEVIAFRSVAAYIYELLKTAAGSVPVGHFR